MSIWKRAFYSVTRKRAKSIVLLLLLILIVSAVGAVITVQNAMNNMQTRIENEERADFIISSYEERDGGLLQSDAEMVADIEGIEKVHFRLNVVAKVSECEVVPAVQDGITLNEDLQNAYKNSVTVIGTTESEHQGVWIHEQFAINNDLKIGSKIKLENSDMQSTVELEVAGIYQGSDEQTAIFPQDMIENTLYTSLSTAQYLQGGVEAEKMISSAFYYVEASKDTAAIMEEVKKLPLNWENCILEDNQEAYESILDMTKNMEKLIRIMVLGIIAVCFFVLSMVMVFWIQSRVHETGILLSIGISKARIILQYMLEMLGIAVVSFILAYYPSRIFAKRLGMELMEQLSMAEELNAVVGFSDMLYVYGISTIMIVLSIGVSSIMIVRLKPREILSKMS